MSDDLDRMLAEFNDSHAGEKPPPEQHAAGGDVFADSNADGSDPLAELDFQDAPQTGDSKKSAHRQRVSEDTAQLRSLLVEREGVHLVPGENRTLDFLLSTNLEAIFSVGRAQMMIGDLLILGQGSVVELRRLIGEKLDFLINDKLIARGELVVINERYGCRITHVLTPEERIKALAGVTK